jgi:5-methylcytosine-specific restriction enzyme A
MPWENDPEKRRRDTANYDSAEYKRNRPIAMRRDRWRCQIQAPGICIGAASQCDHIIPVTQGGGHKLDNLRAACGPCHARKTAGEGGGYRNKPPDDPQPRPRTAW